MENLSAICENTLDKDASFSISQSDEDTPIQTIVSSPAYALTSHAERALAAKIISKNVGDNADFNVDVNVDDEPLTEAHTPTRRGSLTSPIVGSPVGTKRRTSSQSSETLAADINRLVLSNNKDSASSKSGPKLEKCRVVVAGGISISLTPTKSPRGNSLSFASPLSPSVRRASSGAGHVEIDAIGKALAKANGANSEAARAKAFAALERTLTKPDDRLFSTSASLAPLLAMPPSAGGMGSSMQLMQPPLALALPNGAFSPSQFAAQAFQPHMQSLEQLRMQQQQLMFGDLVSDMNCDSNNNNMNNGSHMPSFSASPIVSFGPAITAFGTVPPAAAILRKKALGMAQSGLPAPAIASRRRSSISFLATPQAIADAEKSASYTQAEIYAFLLSSRELVATAAFLESLICIGGIRDETLLAEFRTIIIDLMAERFSECWDISRPQRGIAMRTISHMPHLGDASLDPLLQTAFVLCNIHPRYLLDLMPVSFTLYIMPGMVTYTTSEFTNFQPVCLFEARPYLPPKTLDPVDHGAEIRLRALKSLELNPQKEKAFNINEYFGGSSSLVNP